MSQKWMAIIGCIVAAVISLAIHDYIGHQVRVAVAASPGQQPSLTIAVQSLLAMISAAGFSVGGVLAWLHKWEESAVPAGPAKKMLVAAINEGEQAVGSKLYNGSTDPTFRKAVRDAFKIDADSTFNANFPLDPKIDGPVSL